MTKYLIGIQDFERIRTSGYAYVDKTALIYKLADEGSYYFLSRPRRFGKSLLLSTMKAYFRGRRELFEGLAIEKLEEDWTVYPIMHLDLNIDRYDSAIVLKQRLNLFLSDFEARYGRNVNEATLSQRFEGIIKRTAQAEGQRVVILVDEYDKPMLQAMDNDKLQDETRSILKAFYGALKSCDRYIRFAFLTGVTKFGKVSVFSDLNNLMGISMDARYQTICGIIDKEIHIYFEGGLQNVVEANGLSYDETVARLKKRYDGYHFRQRGVNIYNPFSLLNTFSTGEFGSYWFEMGTPSLLVKLLQGDKYYLPNLTEEQVSAGVLNSVDSMSKSPIPVFIRVAT